MSLDKCPQCQAQVAEGFCFVCQVRVGNPSSPPRKVATVSERPRNSGLVIKALGFAVATWGVLMLLCLLFDAPGLAGFLTFVLMFASVAYCGWALLSKRYWTFVDFVWRFAVCTIGFLLLFARMFGKGR